VLILPADSSQDQLIYPRPRQRTRNGTRLMSLPRAFSFW